MNRIPTVLIALLSAGSLVPGLANAQTVAGSWSGTATTNQLQVPVELRLSAPDTSGAIKGSFMNGGEAVASSGGQLTGHHLVLNFDYFARKLEGDLEDGKFTGTYSGARITTVPVELHFGAPAARSGKPAIADRLKIIGDWEIAVQSPKGESAWTLRISPDKEPQAAPDAIKAVILRIDGDTGGLWGGYDSALAAYKVSHFTAAGPAVYSIKPQKDGTLLVSNLARNDQQWTARRAVDARKQNLAPPTKTTDQTGVVDPNKPFTFSAPDLAGKVVTNDDPRLKHKVVIVAIGGSWCPNCHDEAPFLVDLYTRYHAKGLEIVNISFEEEDQLKDPKRLHAFVARYHIPYLVLLGGTPEQVNQALPQGKNLNCWPTSFFVGRDGLVKEVHAGFSSADTGESYAQLKTETDALVEKMLAQ